MYCEAVTARYCDSTIILRQENNQILDHRIIIIKLLIISKCNSTIGIDYYNYSNTSFNPQNLRNIIKKVAKISITQIIIELVCQNNRILLFF